MGIVQNDFDDSIYINLTYSSPKFIRVSVKLFQYFNRRFPLSLYVISSISLKVNENINASKKSAFDILMSLIWIPKKLHAQFD